MDPSRIWDERYARQDPAQARSSYEPWLERWYPRLHANVDRPLLDLGCGNGLDAAYLIRRGFRVVGVPKRFFSHSSLEQLFRSGCVNLGTVLV